MRFDSYHPLVNLLFFTVVIVCALQFSHPLFAAAGFACSLIYMLKLRGRAGVRFAAGALLVGALWAAGFVLTTHFGVTNLGQSPVGNSVTLESAACGGVQGVQLATLLLWLNCLTALFTVDKVVFLLGRVAPRLSLGCALVLRAAPVLNARRHAISWAQSGIGAGPGQGSPATRVRKAGQRVGVLVSWGIDRGFAVGASLSSRGVALKGRTAFSLYRFDTRDRGVVIGLVLLATVVGVGTALNQTVAQYDPELVIVPWTGASSVVLVAYLVFCLTPWLLQMLGEAHWARRAGRVYSENASSPRRQVRQR